MIYFAKTRDMTTKLTHDMVDNFHLSLSLVLRVALCKLVIIIAFIVKTNVLQPFGQLHFSILNYYFDYA